MNNGNMEKQSTEIASISNNNLEPTNERLVINWLKRPKSKKFKILLTILAIYLVALVISPYIIKFVQRNYFPNAYAAQSILNTKTAIDRQINKSALTEIINIYNNISVQNSETIFLMGVNAFPSNKKIQNFTLNGQIYKELNTNQSYTSADLRYKNNNFLSYHKYTDGDKFIFSVPPLLNKYYGGDNIGELQHLVNNIGIADTEVNNENTAPHDENIYNSAIDIIPQSTDEPYLESTPNESANTSIDTTIETLLPLALHIAKFVSSIENGTVSREEFDIGKGKKNYYTVSINIPKQAVLDSVNDLYLQAIGGGLIGDSIMSIIKMSYLGNDDTEILQKYDAIINSIHDFVGYLSEDGVEFNTDLKFIINAKDQLVGLDALLYIDNSSYLSAKILLNDSAEILNTLTAEVVINLKDNETRINLLSNGKISKSLVATDIELYAKFKDIHLLNVNSNITWNANQDSMFDFNLHLNSGNNKLGSITSNGILNLENDKKIILDIPSLKIFLNSSTNPYMDVRVNYVYQPITNIYNYTYPDDYINISTMTQKDILKLKSSYYIALFGKMAQLAIILFP